MKYFLLTIACVLLTVSAPSAQTKRNTPAKPKVDLAKKIADATPAALPQGPRTGKPRSDAQDENLRGKVKSVIEYSQEPGGARVIDHEKYFDEDGYLIREIEYDEAYPSSVTVWGFVDGVRVSKTNEIEYAKGEKPPPRGQELLEMPIPDPMYANVPSDPRFDSRYTYKYDDQGRQIELRNFQSNGQPGTVHVFLYSGNARDQRDYESDGTELSHTQYMLDTNGNTVEERMFGSSESDIVPDLYSHQLDSQGNWIVEKVSEKSTVRGKSILKPRWTTYRTITYYP